MNFSIKPHYLILFSVICAHATLANAEVIQIPVGAQGTEASVIEKPRTGMSSEQVRAQFGEPSAATPAVGDPPISRWEYPNYFVFFEHDHVIHAVVKHTPQNLSE